MLCYVLLSFPFYRWGNTGTWVEPTKTPTFQALTVALPPLCQVIWLLLYILSIFIICELGSQMPSRIFFQRWICISVLDFCFFGDFWEEDVVDIFVFHSHESRSPQSFTFRRWVQLWGATRKATRKEKWVKSQEETYFNVDPLGSVQWKYLVGSRESMDFGVRLTQVKTPAITVICDVE